MVPRIRYDAGDHVAVYPTNNVDLVERIGQLLNLDLDTVFTMKNLDEDSTKKTPFPCPTTYRTALLHYVDIMALPRTHVLKEFAEYTTDEVIDVVCTSKRSYPAAKIVFFVNDEPVRF